MSDKNKFILGDVVKISRQCPFHSKKPERLGTVVGLGRKYRATVYVKWQGTTGRQSYHEDFLVLAKERDAA